MYLPLFVAPLFLKEGEECAQHGCRVIGIVESQSMANHAVVSELHHYNINYLIQEVDG